MSSLPNETSSGIFTPSAKLLDVIMRYRFVIFAALIAGIALGLSQKNLTQAYHVRAIINVGYRIGSYGEFAPTEPLSDIARRIREDVEKTNAKNIRTAFITNQTYKKLIVTIIATLPDAQESKRAFDSIIEDHIKRLTDVEKKIKKKRLISRTSRLVTPSTDTLCTAGCKVSFTALYAVAAALSALIGCMLFEQLKNRKA